MESRGMKIWNVTVQICMPTFTIASFLLTSMKLPQYGVIAGLFSEIFWFYAAWRAWKGAGQIGILINTFLATIIFAYGVLNYWYF
jgi:hypothetical protein